MYGPATINSSGYVDAGATLRVRDVDFDVGNSIVCKPETVGGPMPTLDLVRVTMNSPLVVQGLPCVVNVRHSHLTSPTTDTNISASGEIAGSGGATANRGSIITIDQSVIEGGDPAVALFNFSTAQISNSVIKNASPANGAISSGQGGPITVAFTTFYNSRLICGGGSTLLTSKNNIFLNERAGAPADTVTGTACSHDYDFIKPQTTAPTGANNILNMDPRFTNGAAGDFHLLVGSPAIDAADPTATATVDYDGTARPQGVRRDIGAFEYKP
jgi:hypothetical protein